MLEDVSSVLAGIVISLLLMVVYVVCEVVKQRKNRKAVFEGYLVTDELKFAEMLKYGVLSELDNIPLIDRMFLTIANDRISSFIAKYVCIDSLFKGTIQYRSKEVFTVIEKAKYVVVLTIIRHDNLYLIPIYIKVNMFSIDVIVKDILVATETNLRSAVDFDLTNNECLATIDNLDIIDDLIKIELNKDKNIVVSLGETVLDPYIVGELK